MPISSAPKGQRSQSTSLISKSGELEREGTCSILEHIGNDGKQLYRTMFYNLDAILSVGYRVNSRNATLFRRWATQVLKTYLLKGYAVNTRLNQLEDKVDRHLAKHDDRIATLEPKVDFFVQAKEPPIQGVFYDGQLWDARAGSRKVWYNMRILNQVKPEMRDYII